MHVNRKNDTQFQTAIHFIPANESLFKTKMDFNGTKGIAIQNHDLFKSCQLFIIQISDLCESILELASQIFDSIFGKKNESV